MRAVVQRVQRAHVRVDGDVVGSIGPGLAVLVGVAGGDTSDDARRLADKIVGMRVFADSGGKMNRSVGQIDGAVLVVSQFTLYGDLRRGRRPSFTAAADPEAAEQLVREVARRIGESVPVSEGRFGASMEVELVNDGPVTILLEVESGKVV